MAFKIIKTTFDPKRDRLVATVEFLPSFWLLRRKKWTRVYMGSGTVYHRMFDGRRARLHLGAALSEAYASYNYINGARP